MKTVFYMLVLLTLLLAACASQRRNVQLASPAPITDVATEADAIAVVLADIQNRGGDPRRTECRAMQMDDGWHVTAWHIWYPRKKGSSRFVPGGFTSFVVSTDGRILRTVGGR